MSDFRLVELNSDNLMGAIAIPPQVGEKAYVTPTAWPRVIWNGDKVVGCVMANWDPDNEIAEFPRRHLEAEHRRKGRGPRCRQVRRRAGSRRARRRGYEKITVLWDPAEGGPERFYLRVGLEKTGELFGETVGTLRV
jgi:diamine N-acetyltransferase